MKVFPFKVPRGFDEPILVQHDQDKFIYDILHRHPELQIIYIREGSGTAIIGEYIGAFCSGDVFVIGSNVHHVFRSDEVYFLEDTDLLTDVYYLFLDEKLPENELLNFVKLKEFFNSAKYGVKLKSNLKAQVGFQMEGLTKLYSMDLLMGVMNILNALSKSSEKVYLNNTIAGERIDEGDCKRLDNVIQYTFQHYSDKITLKEVSEVANMVPSAFCRFFKRRTRKTYFDFLNEIRIRSACNLLLNKDKTIVEICFQSGFNNLSYFNRKFKDMTGFSPLKYHKALNGNSA